MVKMAIIDKKGILKSKFTDTVSIEIGCGTRKRHINSIGIDIIDSCAVDIIGDINEVLLTFPNESIDSVYGYHSIEHVKDISILLSELYRVVKPGGLPLESC